MSEPPFRMGVRVLACWGERGDWHHDCIYCVASSPVSVFIDQQQPTAHSPSVTCGAPHQGEADRRHDRIHHHSITPQRLARQPPCCNALLLVACCQLVTHHCVSLDAVDEDRHRQQALRLQLTAHMWGERVSDSGSSSSQ